MILKNLKLEMLLKKKPISVEKDLLAAKALKIMNDKKITSLCVHNKKNKQKTIGILHIHTLLQSSIT